MQKYINVLILVVFLVFMALGLYRWQIRLWDSAVAYRSPIQGDFPATGDPLPAQANRVFVVIISGLSVASQQLLTLPTIERLQESGASTIIESTPPSYRYPAWTSLLSGAKPAFNDAPLLDKLDEVERFITINTVLVNAREQGLGVAVVGARDWQTIIPSTLPNRLIASSFSGEQGDQQMMNNALDLIDDETLDLVILQFNQIEGAIAESGGISGEVYDAAVLQIDNHLAQLVSLLDLNKITLIITGDHGHIQQGGHGGDDLIVLQQPFIMLGEGITPGNYSTVAQIDVAPTIALLLGLSLPAINQGRPIFEMLKVDEADTATVLVALAYQRISLLEAYLQALDIPLTTLTDLKESAKMSETFLQNQNFAGAAQLAQLVIEQTDDFTETVKVSKLSEEGRLRWWAVAIFIGGIFIFLWRRHSFIWPEALVSGGILVGAYHLLHQVSRKPYSFSAIDSLNQTWWATGQQVALSILLGCLFFLLLLILRQHRDWGNILQSCYELLLFAMLGFMVPVLQSFQTIGVEVSWFFPDVSLLFLYITGLMQTFWVIAIGLFIPLLIVPLNSLFQGILANYQHKQLENLARRSQGTTILNQPKKTN